MKKLKFLICFLSVLSAVCLFLPALHIHSTLLHSTLLFPDIHLSLFSLFRFHSIVAILSLCGVFFFTQFDRFSFALIASFISLVCVFSSLSQLVDQLHSISSFPLSMPVSVSDYYTSLILAGALILSFVLILICMLISFSDRKMEQIEQLG